MLELILGNERFTNFWMNAYEYEILQNRERFTQEIANVVKLLPGRLPFQGDLKDFMLQFSNLNPLDRPSVKSLMSHPWVSGAVKKMSIGQPSPK